MGDALSANGMSRADVIRLGREGSPAQFVPVALQALKVSPGDDAVRLLAASAAERWGLMTLARELWNGIDEKVRALPEVRRIVGEAVRGGSAAGDEVVVDEAVWEVIGRKLGVEVERLKRGGWGTVYAASDGTRVWRTAEGDWRGFGTTVSEAEAAAASLGEHASGFPPPVVVAGMEPGVLAAAVLKATARERLGYLVRVVIVEPDVAAVVAACACVPALVEWMKEERVELFVGPGCVDAFEAKWMERLACTLPERVLSVRGELRTVVAGAIERLHSAQRAEVAWGVERVRAGEVRGVGREIRRALVLTSRYTTFVRHSVEGLVAALERAGVRTRVLMEPDAYSTLTGGAYLREVMEHPPDVVIGSNCSRAWFGDILPRNVPFVSWIQDAIPKLFDVGTAKAQGPFDVLVGYVFSELADQHGYDVARMHYAGMPIDGARFHRGAVASEDAARFRCDVAMVSHHSETPAAMLERLIAEIGKNDAMRTFMKRLVPVIEDAVRHANTDWPFSRLRRGIREEAERVGGVPETLVTAILRQFALPLADRMLRHESLEWAAAIADERGLKLHLYGNGWERHPTLGRFAKGPLAHGEELRAAYACAKLNLHVSITTLVHQRVSECALAGGLCVARYHRDAISGPRATAMLELIEREPDVVDEANGRIGYVVADHPAAMRQYLLFTRLGEPTDGAVLWVNAARAKRAKTHRRLIDHDQDANELFGDLAELTYQTREGLAGLIERACDGCSWREAQSRAVAGFAARRLSFDTLVERMLAAVREATAGAEVRVGSGAKMVAEPVA